MDINELYKKITIKGLVAVADTDVLELLDRLEALENERDALRAKVEQMEQQEPVGIVASLFDEYVILVNNFDRAAPVYLAPGAQAQPAQSVPDYNIRGSIRLLKRASGHLRWLKKDAYQWRNLNPKTRRAAELLHRDIDAMLAAAPEFKP